MKILRFNSPSAWLDAALAEFKAGLQAAAARSSPSLSMTLAGGSTPEPVYRAMAALSSQALQPGGGGAMTIHLWPGDERFVPFTDPQRNGAMIARAFSGSLWQPQPVVHQWPLLLEPAGGPAPGPAAGSEASAVATATPAEAAAAYAQELVSVLGPAPVFDLAWQGLGADGHTASVFKAGAEPHTLAYPAQSPVPPHQRLSLSLDLLAASRRIVFLVRGEDKKKAVRALEDRDPAIPASRLALDQTVVLYLEQ